MKSVITVDAIGVSSERLARIGAHHLGVRHRREKWAGGTVKPKLFVHRIHEHGDEWIFTIGTKLAVGPPRVRPGDAKTADTSAFKWPMIPANIEWDFSEPSQQEMLRASSIDAVDKFLDSFKGPHWPF